MPPFSKRTPPHRRRAIPRNGRPTRWIAWWTPRRRTTKETGGTQVTLQATTRRAAATPYRTNFDLQGKSIVPIQRKMRLLRGGLRVPPREAVRLSRLRDPAAWRQGARAGAAALSAKRFRVCSRRRRTRGTPNQSDSTGRLPTER